jgi:Na+/citrate or Na+/malate symporter
VRGYPFLLSSIGNKASIINLVLFLIFIFLEPVPARLLARPALVLFLEHLLQLVGERVESLHAPLLL